MSKVENNNDMNVGCITNQNFDLLFKIYIFLYNKHLLLKDCIFNLFN